MSTLIRAVRDVCILSVLMLTLVQAAGGQGRLRQVQGALFGGALKYHGEQTDDMFGVAGGVSLGYAVMDRLQLDARVLVGEYRWKITPTKIAALPEYFGPGARIGDRYPGTQTLIDSLNVSSATMVDLTASYVIVPGIRARPFITAGVGLLAFAPSNASEYAPLPNNLAGEYSTTVASLILGGGVQLPLSQRVGLILRGERRIVFSQFLDDINPKRTNDALSMVSVGLTYTFNSMAPKPRRHSHEDRSEACDAEDPDKECIPHRGAPPGWDKVFEEQDELCFECTSCTMCRSCYECVHVKCNICLCCYCRSCSACCCMPCPMRGGKGGDDEEPAEGKGAAPEPKPAPKPQEPEEPEEPQEPEESRKPDGVEPMSVPCPGGQHRECFGAPGFGICVDDEPPRGPQKIRWDLARTLEDGSLLRESEADGRWYRRQIQPDGTERISKGTLPFEVTDCKECREKMK